MSLEQDIESLTKKLLTLVRGHCWNKIPKDCLYILSEIKDPDLEAGNYRRQIIKEKRMKTRRMPRALKEVLPELRALYPNIYDVNLFVLQIRQNKTVVDIGYYPKSALSKERFEQVKDNPPMLHAKLSLPAYAKKRKFDVHWELGGWRYHLNMLYYRMNFLYKEKIGFFR